MDTLARLKTSTIDFTMTETLDNGETIVTEHSAVAITSQEQLKALLELVSTPVYIDEVLPLDTCNELSTPYRIVGRVEIVKNGKQEYIAKAFDQNGIRFSEADFYTEDKHEATKAKKRMLASVAEVFHAMPVCIDCGKGLGDSFYDDMCLDCGEQRIARKEQAMCLIRPSESVLIVEDMVNRPFLSETARYLASRSAYAVALAYELKLTENDIYPNQHIGTMGSLYVIVSQTMLGTFAQPCLGVAIPVDMSDVNIIRSL